MSTAPKAGNEAVTFQNILFKIDAGIARLTLNRPDRLNSFNDAMHAEVRQALALVDADNAARVLLLTGAGRGFCAGADLSEGGSTFAYEGAVEDHRDHGGLLKIGRAHV